MSDVKDLREKVIDSISKSENGFMTRPELLDAVGLDHSIKNYNMIDKALRTVKIGRGPSISNTIDVNGDQMCLRPIRSYCLTNNR